MVLDVCSNPNDSMVLHSALILTYNGTLTACYNMHPKSFALFFGIPSSHMVGPVHYELFNVYISVKYPVSVNEEYLFSPS